MLFYTGWLYEETNLQAKILLSNSIMDINKEKFSVKLLQECFFGLSTIQKNKMNFQDYPLGKKFINLYFFLIQSLKEMDLSILQIILNSVYKFYLLHSIWRQLFPETLKL